MQKINEKKFGFSRNFYFLCIYIRKKPKNKKHMKTILIEKTKRIVLDYLDESDDKKKLEEKIKNFKKLEIIEVSDYNYSIIKREFDFLYGQKILIYNIFGIIKITEIHKNFVIYHSWKSILNANTDYIIPPFATADSTYHHQTYEMKIMCAYGFKFARVRDLNAFQYPGQLHGNKTLLKAKYSHFEL